MTPGTRPDLLTCPYCHPWPWWDESTDHGAGVAAVNGFCELGPDAVGLEEFERLHNTPEHIRRQIARRQHLRVVR